MRKTAPRILGFSFVLILASTSCRRDIYQEVRAGNLEKVKSMVERNPSLVQAKDDYGESRTPLHWAVRWDQKEIVEFLIEKGAEVNSRDNSDTTPLYFAVTINQKDLAELLLSQGADVNAKNNHDFTSLHLAAIKGFQEMVEFLLTQGADVNARDDKGNTPLHYAAVTGSKEMVELLRPEEEFKLVRARPRP
jgi:cytohesin